MNYVLLYLLSVVVAFGFFNANARDHLLGLRFFRTPKKRYEWLRLSALLSLIPGVGLFSSLIVALIDWTGWTLKIGPLESEKPFDS